MSKVFSLNSPVRQFHLVFFLMATSVAVWAYFAQPGMWFGSLHGQFTLTTERGDEIDIRFITIDAETAPQWQWSWASDFTYPVVRVQVEGEHDANSMTVLFPGPRSKTGQTEETLTSERFGKFVMGPRATVGEPARELYAFVLSIGQGSVQPPRHHPYHVDKLYGPYTWSKGAFTHFRLGEPAFAYLLGILAAIWFATTVTMWLIRRGRRPAAGPAK